MVVCVSERVANVPEIALAPAQPPPARDGRAVRPLLDREVVIRRSLDVEAKIVLGGIRPFAPQNALGEPFADAVDPHAAVDFPVDPRESYRLAQPVDEEVFLGPALLLALALRATFTLHASAIAYAGRAVLFAGDSGAGKSTLAAALARIQSRGATRLADDIVPVSIRGGRLVAWSDYPQLKLPPDAQVGTDPVLEPFLPMISWTDRRMPTPPLLPLALLKQTGGSIVAGTLFLLILLFAPVLARWRGMLLNADALVRAHAPNGSRAAASRCRHLETRGRAATRTPVRRWRRPPQRRRRSAAPGSPPSPRDTTRALRSST